MELTRQERNAFLETLWEQYRLHGRPDLPWRLPEKDGSFDPYKIMVSELMLQQTQVARVIPKYEAFLVRFPDIQALARAGLGDVLRAWQGLGYNRRAKFLWQAAQELVGMDAFPEDVRQLVKLPGIGPNTAGAILAYGFNCPTVFVETNVRTVYIHHFFHDRTDVADKDIVALVEHTLDRENPREFYWALMDYGSYLKATVGNPNTASKHYTKQSPFHGSRRAVRGQIIRLLGVRAHTFGELTAAIADERLEGILNELEQEGMISQRIGTYSLD